MKYKVELQDEQYTCGISCIKMILNRYHIVTTEREIQKRSGLLLSGITLSGMIACFRSYGIEAKGYKGEIEQLDVNHASILLVEHHGMNHYILFDSKKGSYYRCIDPDSGVVYYTVGELSQIFLNRVVVIYNAIYNKQEKREDLKTLIQYYLKCFFKEIMVIFLLSMVLWALSLSTQFMISELIQSYSFYLMVLCALILLLKELIDYLLECYLLSFRVQSKKKVLLKKMLTYLQSGEEVYLSNKVENRMILLEKMEEVFTYINRLFSHLFLDLMLIVFVLIYLFYYDRDLFIVSLLLMSGVVILFSIKQDKIKMYERRLLSLYQKFSGDCKERMLWRIGYRLKNKDHLLQDYEQYLNEQKDIEGKYILLEKIIGSSFVIFEMGIILYSLSMQMELNEIYLKVMLISLVNSSFMELYHDYLDYYKMNTIYLKTIETASNKEPFKEKVEHLRLDNFAFSYGYNGKIIENCDISFPKHCYLIGNNGCGKTTLLKLLAGYYDHYLGHYYINEHEAKNLSFEDLNHHLVYLDSEVELPFYSTAELFDHDFLKRTGFEDLYNLPVEALSRGQKQIIVFLYSIFLKFDVYLLDECFNHIDDECLKKIYVLLEGELLADQIVVYSEHHVKKIPKTFESVIMKEKKIERI